MLLIAAVLAVRFVTWVAQQVTRQLDDGFAESDALGALGGDQAPPGRGVGDLVGVDRASSPSGSSCRSPTFCSFRWVG